MKRRKFITSASLTAAGLALAEAGMAGAGTIVKTLKRPVCAFTKCLQFLPVEQVGEVLARLGFDGADLLVRPGGQIEPMDAKKELPQAVKTFRKQGAEILMIVTAIKDPTEPFALATLEAAADSGIKYYRLGWFDYDFKKTIQQNLDGFKRTMEKIARINEKLGLHGGYQNHSGIGVGAPVWDLYELLKEVNPQYLGVQYDIRHAVTEGGNSWRLGLKRVEPWIRSVAIKDFIWEKNSGNQWHHQTVPLGEGMVPYDDYLKDYAALKVEAPISIHFEYDLGGADTGKKETTMPKKEIFKKMQKDLIWLRQKMSNNQIEP